jgi:acyl carrier protein
VIDGHEWSELPVNEIRDNVRKKIDGLLGKKGDHRGFGNEDSLIAGGRLDSVDVVEIVILLEQDYGIDFAEDGFDRREFECESDPSTHHPRW